MDHPAGIDRNILQRHQGEVTPSHQPEDMGEVQDLLSLRPPRSKDSDNNCRERGYTVEVQKFYGVPPPSPEKHHEAIDHINTIVQGIQMHSHKLEGLAQANVVIIISNTAVM